MFDKIVICLEQKIGFANQLLSLSNQIAELADDENNNIDEMIKKRQDNMARIDKCDALIKLSIKNLTDDEQKIVAEALKIEKSEELSNSVTYLKIHQLACEYNNIVKKIITINSEISKKVKINFDIYKDKINESRKKKTRGNKDIHFNV